MTLTPETLVVRGGSMPGDTVRANIRDVALAYGRNGICLKALIDDEVDVRADRLVPHRKVCLTTPRLLEEEGVPADIEATNDLGDRYQYTLWLPDGDLNRLTATLKKAFRGPFLKEEVSREWTTEDLRGLQRP